MFTKTSMLVAGIMALVLSVSVWAITAAERSDLKKGCGCPNIVDVNGNGICDRKEDGSCLGGSGPGAGCGQCPGAENCPQFVDENKNGICDRMEQGACPTRQGCGKCAQSVGENADACCDLKGQASCPRVQSGGCGQRMGCIKGAANAAWAWDASNPWGAARQ